MKALTQTRRFVISVFVCGVLCYGYATLPAAAQIRPWMPPEAAFELSMTATGTGETTGHIADLTIRNPTDKPVDLSFPMLFIPSGGRYQAYVATRIEPVRILPRETVTLPVHGYCVDIRRPPVPNGEPIPSPGLWIGRDPDMFSETGIIPARLQDYWPISDPTDRSRSPHHPLIDFRPVEFGAEGPFVANHISEDILDRISAAQEAPEPAPAPWFYSPVITKEENVHLAVPLLFDAIAKITATVDHLQSAGQLATPFSRHPERERETVIQQTFWMYSAALFGKPYEREEFEAQMAEQFAAVTGQRPDEAPEPARQRFDEGVDDFWAGFELVGVEAKVIHQPPEAPVAEIPEQTRLPRTEQVGDDLTRHDHGDAATAVGRTDDEHEAEREVPSPAEPRTDDKEEEPDIDWGAIRRQLDETFRDADDELERLRRRYDPDATAEPEDVPQGVRDMLEAYRRLMETERELLRLRERLRRQQEAPGT